jgi:SAM-dependent methyltransferase
MTAALSNLTRVNIGCGPLVRPGWINLDRQKHSPDVTPYDIRRGLPFGDGQVDACYTSHMVEHLSAPEAKQFLTECFRVLKPGGIIRVVVPDLESIAKGYLDALQAARTGEPGAVANYDWMMIELLDQSVRDHPGGLMAAFLRQVPPKDRAFVRSRIALNAEDYWRKPKVARRSMAQKIREKGAGGLLDMTRKALLVGCAHVIWGRRGTRAVKVGLFRDSGEIHKWMYDAYSLEKLLCDVGFTEIQDRGAGYSRIPGFSESNLDVIDGAVAKPSSLFMEGVR